VFEPRRAEELAEEVRVEVVEGSFEAGRVL
jgi:hypothetical protein